MNTNITPEDGEGKMQKPTLDSRLDETNDEFSEAEYHRRTEEFLKLLPQVAREYIKNMAKQFHTHPQAFILPVLASFAQAMGTNFKLVDNHENFPVIYGLNVGQKSAGKSLGFKAFKPVYEEDANLKRKLEPGTPLKHTYLNTSTSIEAISRRLIQSASILFAVDEFDGVLSNLLRGNGKGEQWRSVFNSLFTDYRMKIAYEKDKGEDISSDQAILNIVANIHFKTMSDLTGTNIKESGFLDRYLYVPFLFKRPKITTITSPSEFEELTKEYYNVFKFLYSLEPITREVLLSELHQKQMQDYENELIAMSNDIADYDQDLSDYVAKQSYYLKRLTLWLFVAELGFACPNTLNFTSQDTGSENYIEKAWGMVEYFIYTYQLMRSHISTNVVTIPNKRQVVYWLNKLYPTLNQSKLAEAIGVTRQSVGKMIHDKTKLH